MQTVRNVIECFIPTDSLPSGIGIALRPRAHQRVVETIGVIDQLGRRFALETKHAAVRMVGVGFKPHDLAIRHGSDGRAVRRAQSAKSADGVSR